MHFNTECHHLFNARTVPWFILNRTDNIYIILKLNDYVPDLKVVYLFVFMKYSFINEYTMN